MAVFEAYKGSIGCRVTFAVIFRSFVRDARGKIADCGRFPVVFEHFWVILGCFRLFTAVYRGILAVFEASQGSIGCWVTFSVIFRSFVRDAR